jgi:pyruvate dehydrogenase E1 component alpha subunit
MMLRIRLVEDRLQTLYAKGFVAGPCHLARGQEAITVGAHDALRPDDCSIGTYRGHGHALARGVPTEGVIAEVLGRATGVCGGKGGSMHVTSVEHGYYGSYAIIGAHLPIACGLAWAAKLRGDDQVTACFFGDGTTNIGAFHEALNLAATWALPVVFVCENNQYMEYTPISTVIPVQRPAADRAGAYGLEALTVDGNDVDAVAELVAGCVARARAGDGPSLVEALTYRLGGHSAADPATYRPADEVAKWEARDPLPRYREVLEGRGVPASELDKAEAEVRDEVDAAVEAALAAPHPDPNAVLAGVWADGGSTWRN